MCPIIPNSVTKNFYPRTPVECDCPHLFELSHLQHFYPRTPVECDFVGLLLTLDISFISIHALLWSATLRVSLIINNYEVFLSTHSCGVRPLYLAQTAQKAVHFYPRTPVECDPHSASISALSASISIHALLWSATSVS